MLEMMHHMDPNMQKLLQETMKMQGLPGLPGMPGIPNPQALQGLMLNESFKQFAAAGNIASHPSVPNNGNGIQTTVSFILSLL